MFVYILSKYKDMDYSRLEMFRKAKKLSRQELVNEVGISISTYKQNLAKKNMSIAVLERIANVLEVPVTYFFGETESTKKQPKEYPTNDSISIVDENNPNTPKNMNRLIETQEELIKMQRKAIELLEMRLSAYELGNDISKDTA